MKIGGDMIEVVEEFVNLGTCITKHMYELKDIRMGIGLANNTYHSLFPVMMSREVHRQTEIKLLKTLIRLVWWSGSQTWTLSQTAEKMLNACEGKVLRKLCGPVLGNGQWQSRMIMKFIS
jgi:hypothetical protein